MNASFDIYVLDTSVVLKWFLREIDTEKAEQLRLAYQAGQCLLVAPDMLLIEAANALYFSGQYQADEIQRIVTQLREDLWIEPIGLTLLDCAVGWMFRFNLPVYDLLFLVLARELDVPLVTADERFYNRLQDDQSPSLAVFVQPLRTFSLSPT